MFESLKQAVGLLEQVVASLDPEVLEPAFATTLVGTFARGERLCATGKALAARRVDSSGVWRRSGERSAAHWMARATGESLGKAINELETAREVAEPPGVDQALREGRLSSPQAAHIAASASADPRAEAELLQMAQTESLGGLRERCGRVKAAAESDEAARHQRIHRCRRLCHWCDSEGAFRLDARLTPEAGGDGAGRPGALPRGAAAGGAGGVS